MPSLRPLPVDIGELRQVLEGDPYDGTGRLDLETGKVWPQSETGYPESGPERSRGHGCRWFPSGRGEVPATTWRRSSAGWATLP